MKLPSDESRNSETAVDRRAHSDFWVKKNLILKPQRQDTPYPFQNSRRPYSKPFHSGRPDSRIPVPSTPVPGNLFSYVVRQKRVRTYRRQYNKNCANNIDGSGDRVSRQGPACCPASRESVEFLSKDQINVAASPKESETRVVFCSRVPNPPASPPLVQLYRRNRRIQAEKHGNDKRRSCRRKHRCYEDHYCAYSSDTDNDNSLEEFQESPRFRRQRSHTRAKHSLGLVIDSEGCIQGPHTTRNKHIHFYDRQHNHSQQVPSGCEQDRGDFSQKNLYVSQRAPGLPPLPPLKENNRRRDISNVNSNTLGVSTNTPGSSQGKLVDIYSNPRVAVGTNNFVSNGSSIRLRRSRGFQRPETPIPSPCESYQSLQHSPVFKSGHLKRIETRIVVPTPVNLPPNSAVSPPSRVHVPSNSLTDLQSFYKALSQCSSRSNLQQPQNTSLNFQHTTCPLCAKLTGKCTLHQRAMTSRYLSDLEWRICHAVNIYVYKNGEEGQTPILIHIPPGKKKNMKTVMSVIQERISYPIGYAKYLFKMNGKKVLSPCELEMYNNYVVASNYDKCFKPVCYNRKRSPLLVLNKDSKHVRELRLKNFEYELSLGEKQKEKFQMDEGRQAMICSQEAMVLRCDLQQQSQKSSSENPPKISAPPGPLMFVNGANAEQTVFKQNPGNIAESTKQAGQNTNQNFQYSLQELQHFKQPEISVAPCVISTVTLKDPNQTSKYSEVQDIAAATSIGPGRYKAISDDPESIFYAKNRKKKRSSQGVFDASGERKVFFEDPDTNNNIVLNTVAGSGTNVLKPRSLQRLFEVSAHSRESYPRCGIDESINRTGNPDQTHDSTKQISEDASTMGNPTTIRESMSENCEPKIIGPSVSKSYTIIMDPGTFSPPSLNNPRVSKPPEDKLADQFLNSAESNLKLQSNTCNPTNTDEMSSRQVGQTSQNQQHTTETFLNQQPQYFIQNHLGSDQDPRTVHQPTMLDTNSFYVFTPARPGLHMSNSVGYFPYQGNNGPKIFQGDGGNVGTNFAQPYPYSPEYQHYYQASGAAPPIYQALTPQAVVGRTNPSNIGVHVFGTTTVPDVICKYNSDGMNPNKSKRAGKRNVAIQMGPPSLLFPQFGPLNVINSQRSSFSQFPSSHMNMSLHPTSAYNGLAMNHLPQMNPPGTFINQSSRNIQHSSPSIPQALTHGKLAYYNSQLSYDNNQNQQHPIPTSPGRLFVPPPTGYRDASFDPIRVSEDQENFSGTLALFSPSRSRKRGPQPENYGS